MSWEQIVGRHVLVHLMMLFQPYPSLLRCNEVLIDDCPQQVKIGNRDRWKGLRIRWSQFRIGFALLFDKAILRFYYVPNGYCS